LNVGGVLKRLRRGGYSGYVSVKVYREPDWETAARESAAFLRELGERLEKTGAP
jgi:sugar phosphate isomerase/epimerase